MDNYPYNPNEPHSQPTMAGSYPNWQGQPPPPPYQPGQFGPPPQFPPKQKEWYQKPFGIVMMLIFFFPVGLYLMWKYASWPKSAKWVVTGIIALLAVCSGIVNATGSTQQTIVQQSSPTAIVTPTPTEKPTPTATPTPKPTPTATPTPETTQAPVQQPAQQPATQSQPQQSAPVTGVNNNPWGYDFNPGSLIYNPNSGFCGYFSCVSTFWTATSGYVVECANNEYSHSGGVRGACSRDGGVEATLYQHP